MNPGGGGCGNPSLGNKRETPAWVIGAKLRLKKKKKKTRCQLKKVQLSLKISKQSNVKWVNWLSLLERDRQKELL